MINIYILDKQDNYILIEGFEGQVLYELLHENGYIFENNCGGYGNCGSCNVYIEEQSEYVKSCQYRLKSDIHIRLPLCYEGENVLLTEGFESDRTCNCDSKCYSIAIDIGTSTIGFALVDVNGSNIIAEYGINNSATAYGSDLGARITYGSSDSGINKLYSMLHNDLKYGIEELLKSINDISSLDIKKLAIAGNATMIHILMGINTKKLGSYPFESVIDDGFRGSRKDYVSYCREKGSKLLDNSFDYLKNNDIYIMLLPGISAFVGGDILSGAIALDMDLIPNDSYGMLIDLGTNGEILLANGEAGLCSATSCGPAFTCSNMEGLNSTSFLDYVSLYIKKGIIDENGLLSKNFIRDGICISDKVSISQDDIRHIQLAKAAICSGIITLKKYNNVNIDKLFLSGGFGYNIKKSTMKTLGLIPEEYISSMIISGNTSLEGAIKCLFNNNFYDRILSFRNRIRYIDLAQQDIYKEIFVENISF